MVYRILESAPTPRASWLRALLTMDPKAEPKHMYPDLPVDSTSAWCKDASASNINVPKQVTQKRLPAHLVPTPSPASHQLSPHLRPSCLSHQCPKPPCLWGSRTETCALTPGLAALWISSFSSKPLRHRGPWAAYKANSPDSITAHVFLPSHPLSTSFSL